MPNPGPADPPELADVGRLARRLLNRAVRAARSEDQPLHGAPGTGKTHTVGYLLGQLGEATVIVISGRALGRIREACSVARSLPPAVVVVEDVDLIAEQREARPGEHPLLFPSPPRPEHRRPRHSHALPRTPTPHQDQPHYPLANH